MLRLRVTLAPPLLLIAFVVAVEPFAAAQLLRPPQPVSCRVTLEPATGPRPRGGIFTAVVTMKIKDGWHVYAAEVPPDGPQPLAITVPAGQPFHAKGKLTASPPESGMDEAFEQVTPFYRSTAIFRLPVASDAQAPPGKRELTLDLRYQACDGQMCLPARNLRLTVPLELSLR